MIESILLYENKLLNINKKEIKNLYEHKINMYALENYVANINTIRQTVKKLYKINIANKNDLTSSLEYQEILKILKD